MIVSEKLKKDEECMMDGRNRKFKQILDEKLHENRLLFLKVYMTLHIYVSLTIHNV